jgi:hypothetical protein
VYIEAEERETQAGPQVNSAVIHCLPPQRSLTILVYLKMHY